MSRGARQGWCELQRFMLRVLDRYPHSQASLATSGGSLTVDQRVFVWDRQAGKVEEQVTVTIPIQGDIVTSATSHVRWDNKCYNMTSESFIWIISEPRQKFK